MKVREAETERVGEETEAGSVSTKKDNLKMRAHIYLAQAQDPQRLALLTSESSSTSDEGQVEAKSHSLDTSISHHDKTTE